jgi:hypothetical protein
VISIHDRLVAAESLSPRLRPLPPPGRENVFTRFFRYCEQWGNGRLVPSTILQTEIVLSYSIVWRLVRTMHSIRMDRCFTRWVVKRALTTYRVAYGREAGE